MVFWSLCVWLMIIIIAMLLYGQYCGRSIRLEGTICFHVLLTYQRIEGVVSFGVAQRGLAKIRTNDYGVCGWFLIFSFCSVVRLATSKQSIIRNASWSWILSTFVKTRDATFLVWLREVCPRLSERSFQDSRKGLSKNWASVNDEIGCLMICWSFLTVLWD